MRNWRALGTKARGKLNKYSDVIQSSKCFLRGRQSTLRAARLFHDTFFFHWSRAAADQHPEKAKDERKRVKVSSCCSLSLINKSYEKAPLLAWLRRSDCLCLLNVCETSLGNERNGFKFIVDELFYSSALITRLNKFCHVFARFHQSRALFVASRAKSEGM